MRTRPPGTDRTDSTRALLGSALLHPGEHLPFGLEPLMRVVLQHPRERCPVTASITCSDWPALSRSVTTVWEVVTPEAAQAQLPSATIARRRSARRSSFPSPETESPTLLAG